MKKIKIIFISLFVFLVASPIVQAQSTTKYYIEANIQSNGDMQVKELKELDGEYNGFSTNLRFKNPSLRTFMGVKEDFEGSTIYNGTDITDLKVYDVVKSTNNFEIINKPNKEFTKVSFASKGDYGVYTSEEVNGGVNLLIYLPSSYNRLSLVTYTVKDVVVIHNDVAEIAWDFISDLYQEDIKDLKVVVNLPRDSEELRVFSHGPLNGENRIVNKHSVEMTYDYLYKGNAVDMRVVFDKDIVSGGTKFSNIDGLDNILAVEKERADKANEIREEARREENRINMIKNIIKVSFGLWFVGLIIILYRIYNKYDKEYKANFDGKYFRDFPATYGPEVVSYLMYKNINNNAFSASILELIRKKTLILQEISVKKKKLIGKKTEKDYTLTKNLDKAIEPITDTEQLILNLIIDEIGNKQSVNLSEIKDYSKSYSNARSFMDSYNAWVNQATANAVSENFYEDTLKAKILGSLYSLIVPIVSLITIFVNLNLGLFYLFNIISIIAIIYFIKITKRTPKGNEDYAKWNGLKNFLLDFSNFDEKELPEIKLWEKYLVYATVFGIADKVQDAMKVKIQNISDYDNTSFTFLYFNNWYFYHTLNTSINDSFSTARSTITSHEIASSTNSSSGGFGGGSSFGGGGFGGGGSSGGRF